VHGRRARRPGSDRLGRPAWPRDHRRDEYEQEHDRNHPLDWSRLGAWEVTIPCEREYQRREQNQA